MIDGPNMRDGNSQSNKRGLRPKRHGRDVFHAWMLEGAGYAGPLDMPVLQATAQVPNRLVAFSDAMNSKWNDFDCWVHFFEDDKNIERFWSNPLAYVNKLKKFRGVIGLDYSVCWDFPIPKKIYNHFRNSTCTYWLQRQLDNVIPQARCEGSDGESVLAGFPRRSILAIGARSMVKDVKDREVLKKSVKYIVDNLDPLGLVWYGSSRYGVAEYPLSLGVPVYFFPGKGRGGLSHYSEGTK